MQNTPADGSNKEIDNTVPNDSAQETYKTEDNVSEEGGAPRPKEDQLAVEVSMDHKNIGFNCFLFMFKFNLLGHD